MVNLDGWAHAYSGKVRDLYVPQSQDGFSVSDVMLVVATDRVSAFDFVLPTPIPDKGKILTQLSLWWFDQLSDITENHVVSLDVPAEVEGRAMLVRKLDMYPYECVVRGYLSGSGLAEYREQGTVAGLELPEGLGEASKLPEPLFTPATKAAVGEHDENISYAQMHRDAGVIATMLKDASLNLYKRASAIAAERGIILADTKFEFGRRRDRNGLAHVILGDEVLTPDSSRYWDAEDWKPGQRQESFDKQVLRDWLTSPASGWDRAANTPPPALPNDIVEQTRSRYIEVFKRLTGKDPVL